MSLDAHFGELITGIVGVVIGWISRHMSDWFGKGGE